MTNKIKDIFLEIIYSNLSTFLLNILLEIMIPPLEIYLFTSLSKTLLKDIREKKLLTCKNRKYIGYLFLLQLLNYYNRQSFNQLQNPIRVTVRNKITTITENDADVKQLLLLFMPLAILNSYKYILKYILPIVVLFIYLIFFMCKYQPKVGLISILYVVISISYIYNRVKVLSCQAQEVFNLHGKCLKEYRETDNNKDNKDKKIKEAEQNFERERYNFIKNINCVIMYLNNMFYIFCFITVYSFALMKNCNLESIVTMLLFTARYYSSLLLRTGLFIESMGRLRILNDTLSST